MVSKTGTSIFSLMQTGKPYKSYTKTILGQVYVTTINPFSGEPEGIILSGDPVKKNADSIIFMWDEKQDAFFKRANKKHFDTGTLIEYKGEVEVQLDENRFNMLTDEEMLELLNPDTKFFTLQSTVNKMTTIPPIFRMLQLAKKLEKSDKIIKFLEAKLSELQAREYETLDNKEEEIEYE